MFSYQYLCIICVASQYLEHDYVSFYTDTVEIEVSCTTQLESNGDANMTESKNPPRPSSTLQKNAEVLHVLYGLLDSDREPTDADAASLRVLYASS